MWEGASRHDADPPSSKWTWRGRPLPFVPLDRTWIPEDDVPAFAPYYARSRRRAGAAAVAAAAIPVEEFDGDVVVVAGGDDQVWPSVAHAHAIAERRAAHRRATTVIEDPAAGHPIVLPGEPPSHVTRPYRVGGDDGAPERLGALAWPAVRAALRLP